MTSELNALQLRTQALALLQQAAAIDGLKPFGVTHWHDSGASTYIVWATAAPGEAEASKVLESEFEPDQGERLEIEDAFTLDELTGVAVWTRIDELPSNQPYSLHDLYALWDQFGSVPVSACNLAAKAQSIEQPFLHFQAGTHRAVIWRWFEAQHPDFIVGEVMS